MAARHEGLLPHAGEPVMDWRQHDILVDTILACNDDGREVMDAVLSEVFSTERMDIRPVPSANIQWNGWSWRTRIGHAHCYEVLDNWDVPNNTLVIIRSLYTSNR